MRTDDRRPLAAFVCGNAYPLFDPTIASMGGGMEARSALFARGLATTGRWRVAFVVSDFGQDFHTRHEGIDFHIYQPTLRQAGRNVFPRLRKRRWFPAFSFDRSDLALFWQMPLIAAWLALPAMFFPRFWRELAPDVVCCFGNNERSAEVIADCRRAGIPTLLCLASDKDLSPDYRPGNRAANHYGMPKWKGHYSLMHADRIVVQTASQREALREHFGREGVLIRNPVHVAQEDPAHWLPCAEREFVLWIGRADAFNKRPMLFLDLARACPELQFVMIASRSDDAHFRALEKARPANMRLLDHVPPTEIWGWLRRARALVNTSRFEGFPNTFLQAAVMGVPIVSLEVDPDGMLARHGGGLCAHGVPAALREAVLRLRREHALAERLTAAAHRYTLERHEAQGRIAELESCLVQLAQEVPLVPSLPLLKRFA